MKTVIIQKGDGYFPFLLSQISDCPKRLYCRGNVDILKETKVIAVVGSRQISQRGREIIRRIVPSLVKEGWVIVSGMAFGVDAQVHQTCLEVGGRTIAVLASGVDKATPKSNSWIYDEIINKNSLVVSEFKDGTEPRKEYFLARNRIMSGLSLGVLVVEAARRSGSLATAAHAARQGREVWAVPGDTTRSTSEGCNWLISQGAGVVFSGNEIIV